MSFSSRRTIHKENKKALINPFSAQTMFMQGMKGSGKSMFLEKAAETLLNYGWTVLDLHSAPNLENAFYSINMNHRENYLRDIESNPSNRGQIHCDCHRSYPTLILCPDDKRFNQTTIDAYNGYIIKSKEWYIKYCEENDIFPIEFNQSMIGKKIQTSKQPLVAVKYLPSLTTKGSNYDEFRRLIVDAILQCRNEGRVMVLNSQLWDKDFNKFKSLELIIKLLEWVKREYYMEQPQEILDPINEKLANGKLLSKQEWKLKSWGKLAIVMRELGEITAGNLRAEVNSTITKRAILGFIRRSRHAQITVICDFQREQDVDKSISTQWNLFFCKRAPKRLFGDEWKWLFEEIDKKRQWIINKNGGSRAGFEIADRLYPRIEQLASNYCYCIFPDDKFYLWKIPSTSFHHKQPDEDYRQITGIQWEDVVTKAKDIEMSLNGEAPKELRAIGSVSLVQLISSLVLDPPAGKGLTGEKAFNEIIEQADAGKITKPPWKNWKSMQTWFRRNSKNKTE